MSATVATAPQPSAGSQRIEVVGLVGAIAATGLVMLLPTPEGLSPQGHRMAALFMGILVLWSTEALPIAVTSLLAVALQPVFQLTAILPPNAPPTIGAMLGTATANFMSPPFFFVLVMFTIAFAWVKTGLARRFALWMISHAGTDARRAVYVFVFGTGLISMVVSDVPCAAIFMAIALGIFDKLNIQPGSSFGKAIMIGIPVGSLIGGVGTPAGSSINLLGLTMIEQNGGERIPFLNWMAIGIPMVAVLLPVAAWLLLKFFPPEIKTIGVIGDIHQEQRAMGPISVQERKVIVLMGLMIVLWISSTWFPSVDVFVVSIIGACAMFLPGISLFTWKEAQNATGWDTLLMIGGVTTLGQASARTGLAAWLANSALSGLGGLDPLWVIMAISAFTVVIHLLLPINPVINAVMIPPIMVLAKTAGVNGALYALPVVFTASAAFLLPLDAVPLVTYSKGYYKMFDMFVPGLILSAIWVVVMTGLLLLIGPMVGLL